MYVILIDYTSELEDIDSALDAHKIWLNENYAAGRFLASGRREPRTGGVAKHTIVEFRPSRVADDSLARLFGD